MAFPAAVDGVEQQQLDGVSFLPTFNDPNAPAAHRTQYFEMLGNRAIYHDGWVAAARHEAGVDLMAEKETDFALDRWELYHVAEDFSEARGLAQKYPDKLKELRALFDIEARKNDVYPLGAAFSPGKPSPTSGKQKFIYYPDGPRIPDALIPDIGQSSYRITADVLIPESGAEGVMVSYGDRATGFVWYVKDGHLIYENRAGAQHQVLVSQAQLPRGRAVLAFAFERNESDQNKMVGNTSGTGRLYIDGQLTAQTSLPMMWQARDRPLLLGRSANSPVSEAFVQPFEFTGVLEKVTVELQ